MSDLHDGDCEYDRFCTLCLQAEERRYEARIAELEAALRGQGTRNSNGIWHLSGCLARRVPDEDVCSCIVVRQLLEDIKPA